MGEGECQRKFSSLETSLVQRHVPTWKITWEMQRMADNLGLIFTLICNGTVTYFPVYGLSPPRDGQQHGPRDRLFSSTVVWQKCICLGSEDLHPCIRQKSQVLKTVLKTSEIPHKGLSTWVWICYVNVGKPHSVGTEQSTFSCGHHIKYFVPHGNLLHEKWFYLNSCEAPMTEFAANDVGCDGTTGDAAPLTTESLDSGRPDECTNGPFDS